MIVAFLLGLGCAEQAPLNYVEPAVTARVTDVGDQGGTLVVRATMADPSEPWSGPESAGITFDPLPDQVEALGDKYLVTKRWTFGASGTPVITPACPAMLPEEHCPPDLYPSFSPPPERQGMVDISDPGRVWVMPPWWVLALVGGGVFLIWQVARRRRPEDVTVVPPAPKEPPRLRALRAWEAVCRDPELNAEERAEAMSWIFRDYLEEALRLPALKLTTSEILEQLSALNRFQDVLLGRARRLLRATDRVKYAGQGGAEQLFDALEQDLVGFLDATAPAQMTPEERP